MRGYPLQLACKKALAPSQDKLVFDTCHFHFIFIIFEVLLIFFVLKFDKCQNPICFKNELLSFKEPSFARLAF